MKQLEEAIKKLPIYDVSGVVSEAGYDVIVKAIEGKKVLDLIDAFKKRNVCIPRKQLEERILYLESQFQPHDVCCVPCLEKGQIIELQKLLGVETK